MGPRHWPLVSVAKRAGHAGQRIVRGRAVGRTGLRVDATTPVMVGPLVPVPLGEGVARAGVQVTPPRFMPALTVMTHPLGHVVKAVLGAWQRTPPVLEAPMRRLQRRGQPVLGSSVCTHVTPAVAVAARVRDQAKGQVWVPRGPWQERLPLGEMMVVQPAKHIPVEGASVGLPERGGAPVTVGCRVGRRRRRRLRRTGLRDAAGGPERGICVNWQGTCSGTP